MMIKILYIVLYYILGMSMSAWMTKVGKLKSCNDADRQMLTYIMIPLCWPAIPAWYVIMLIGKIHVIIHSILLHTISIFNMRITKEDDDTVIRFHMSKKAEVIVANN